MPIKIAAVTENGETLSNHFGKAPYYKVFILEQGKIVAEQQRSKPHHGEQAGHEHYHAQNLHGHGHEDMFAPIQDCQVLFCGGMGGPAYQKALAAGLEVILTGGEIRNALDAYLTGELASDLRRIHVH